MNLKDFDWASDYEQYLKLKSNGLKKQAELSMAKFIEKFERQEQTVKRQFVDTVHRLAYISNKINLYLPNNLSSGIFKTVLENWMQDEPSNAIPYKWSDDFYLLQRALMIDPLDQETINLFGSRIINLIGMNQHELASGYSYQGNPSLDVKTINFYKPFLKKLSDEQKRLSFEKQLKDLEDTAKKYIAENYRSH